MTCRWTSCGLGGAGRPRGPVRPSHQPSSETNHHREAEFFPRPRHLSLYPSLSTGPNRRVQAFAIRLPPTPQAISEVISLVPCGFCNTSSTKQALPSCQGRCDLSVRGFLGLRSINYEKNQPSSRTPTNTLLCPQNKGEPTRAGRFSSRVKSDPLRR